MTAPLTVSRPELLRNGNDDAFRQLVHGLLAFSTRLQTVRSGLAEMIGLSAIQYTILITAAHLDENNGIGVNRIASHLSLSGAFITVETGKLKKARLVTKKQNPEDRRSVLVQVTHKGNALLAKLAPTQVKVNDALFTSLGKKDFGQLHDMLAGMVRGAEDACAMVAYLSSRAQRVTSD